MTAAVLWDDMFEEEFREDLLAELVAECGPMRAERVDVTTLAIYSDRYEFSRGDAFGCVRPARRSPVVRWAEDQALADLRAEEERRRALREKRRAAKLAAEQKERVDREAQRADEKERRRLWGIQMQERLDEYIANRDIAKGKRPRELRCRNCNGVALAYFVGHEPPPGTTTCNACGIAGRIIVIADTPWWYTVHEIDEARARGWRG